MMKARAIAAQEPRNLARERLARLLVKTARMWPGDCAAAVGQDQIRAMQPIMPSPDRRHGLVPRDRPVCPVRRTEPEARRNPLLNEAVVLLNDVVQ